MLSQAVHPRDRDTQKIPKTPSKPLVLNTDIRTTLLLFVKFYQGCYNLLVDKKLAFEGTHEEIGQQVGLLYKKWHHSYSFMPPLANQYYSNQLKIYEEFYPEYLNFLSGLSKGLGVNKDKIFKFNLTIFLSVASEIASNQCSVFEVHSQGKVLIGRNYDWLESSEKNSKFIFYKFSDRSSFNLNGISDMGTWKPGVLVDNSQFVLLLEDAWNEKGLYIELNGAPGKKTDIGISTPHVVQLIAEQCETVEQALPILERIPVPNSKIFTLADKNGNLAVVEKSLEKGTRVRTSKKSLIATNHFISPDLVSENSHLFQETLFHSSFARYNYLEANLNNNLTFEQIDSLLNEPPMLQNWRGIDRGDVLTIWTLSLSLGDSKYKIKFAPLDKDPVEISNLKSYKV